MCQPVSVREARRLSLWPYATYTCVDLQPTSVPVAYLVATCRRQPVSVREARRLSLWPYATYTFVDLQPTSVPVAYLVATCCRQPMTHVYLWLIYLMYIEPHFLHRSIYTRVFPDLRTDFRSTTWHSVVHLHASSVDNTSCGEQSRVGGNLILSRYDPRSTMRYLSHIRGANLA